MEGSSESKTVVYVALVGNGLIALTKFAAAFYTGSSAMLSEAVHSVVDIGNEGLLLLGLIRSRRRADEQHQFGHGMELYFWAFVVAILIFGLGAGVSFYEGVHKLLEPRPVSGFAANYAVLGAALLIEGASWTVAFRAFNKMRGDRRLLDELRRSKDPAVFTVLYEDSAAILGLLAAGIGLLATQFLHLAWADAAASLAIAVILALTALGLAVETKSLLTGEAARPGVVRQIRELVLAEEAVRAINDLRTVHFGPHDVLVTVSVDFHDGADLKTVEETVTRLERTIKARLPSVHQVFIEAQASEDQ